jgi:hypothetical protein
MNRSEPDRNKAGKYSDAASPRNGGLPAPRMLVLRRLAYTDNRLGAPKQGAGFYGPHRFSAPKRRLVALLQQKQYVSRVLGVAQRMHILGLF